MHDAQTETDAIAARVRELVGEIVAGTSLFLVDLEVRGQKGSRVVDVFVDSDKELGVDDLANVSRELSFLLDAEDLIAGRYNLNVSSPGVNRPLEAPRQYRKNVGRALEVVYQLPDSNSPQTVQGTLVAADDERIKIETSGKNIEYIRYQDITHATVQLPW